MTSQQYKKYDISDLNKAVDEVWQMTGRLRIASNGAWCKGIAPIVTKIASTRGVPVPTLRRRVKKRMNEQLSTESAVEREEAGTKRKADARGLLKGIEMRVLYDWADYMRKYYSPPTSAEVRAKVGYFCNHCISISHSLM